MLRVLGRRPLISEDIANAAIYMLNQPLNISVKAMDVVPSGKWTQSSL
jgi:NADP-dependent 3-hydroxy acid dehydrogenase YdfG